MSKAKPAFPDPRTTANVVYNPSPEELREFSSGMERTTEFGSPSYVSEFRSRSSDRTKNAVDDRIKKEDEDHIERAHAYLQNNEMICVDRKVGRHPEYSHVCRYFVPKEYGRIALALCRLLEPAEEGATPDFTTLQIPDWEDTRIRIFPEEGTTYVLGSDYTGEAKKSFLRLFMFAAKRAGGLGLHAGSKQVAITHAGEQRNVGQLYLGLSATGKSTLTGHGFDLAGPDSAEMLQDDVCALYPDGTVTGSEGNGLYIKTIGLEEEEQPEIYHAATQPHAVFENVDVAEDGTVDFDSDRYTGNSRAVIRRSDLPNSADELDLEDVDQVFFITRNPLMPPVARLNAAQGAAAFMLGESIETSAGDPSRAGEAIRVVGTNPFIIGSEGEEGNRFMDLVEANDLDCFVINTGSLGDGAKDVGVNDTVTLLREVTKGAVEWTEDDVLGLELPSEVDGLDVGAFYPPDHVENYEEQWAALKEERREYLASFADLRREITDADY